VSITNISCYVLTIEEEGGPRRRNAIDELAAVGIRAEFVRGFRKDDPKIHGEYNWLINRVVGKRDLTSGEIAVYCGHRESWRRILSTRNTHALVLDDDFSVIDPKAFSTAITDAYENPTSWNVLKFFDFKPKRVLASRRIGSTNIVRYKYAASGAVAYLIDRNAATKMLSRKRFFRAVDEDFSWSWELDLCVWSVSPNLVAEVSDGLGGSLLEEDRLRNKRQRNILRSLWGNVIQAYKMIRSKLYNMSSQ